MSGGVSQVVVSSDQQWYVYDPSNKMVYWIRRDTLEMMAVSGQPPTTLTASCINSFTVTPSQKVVLATCSGLYAWLGYWIQFDSRDTAFVRALNDYFVYAIDVTIGQPYQVPIARGKARSIRI